jgi:hypothetical protein
VDLSNGQPRVFEGATEDPDATLDLSEESLREFLSDPSRIEAHALEQGASPDDNASAVVRLFRLLHV